MSKTFQAFKEDTWDTYANFELDEAFHLTHSSLNESYLEDIVEGEVSESLTEEQQSELNEAGLSVPLIISMVLAAPSIIKSLTKAVGFIYKKLRGLFGGNQNDEETAIQKMIQFTEKWHHSYVKIVEKILKYGGVFKSAKMDDPHKQEKAAEVVFYTIIFGFAVYGGIASAKAITKMVKNTNLHYIDMAALESVLTSVKAQEVKEFVSELMS